MNSFASTAVSFDVGNRISLGCSNSGEVIFKRIRDDYARLDSDRRGAAYGRPAQSGFERSGCRSGQEIDDVLGNTATRRRAVGRTESWQKEGAQ